MKHASLISLAQPSLRRIKYQTGTTTCVELPHLEAVRETLLEPALNTPEYQYSARMSSLEW